MKIIAIKWKHGSSDFGFAIVNDDTASKVFASYQAANHQGRFDIAMFSPDPVEELARYIKAENDTQKAEEEKDTV